MSMYSHPACPHPTRGVFRCVCRCLSRSLVGRFRSGGLLFLRIDPELLVDLFGCTTLWSSGREVELVTLRQEMKPDAEYGQRTTLGLGGDVRVGHVARVDDGHAALAQNPRAAEWLHFDRRVLVDPQAKDPGILSHHREQPTHPPALGEVLVDEHVLREAEP